MSLREPTDEEIMLPHVISKSRLIMEAILDLGQQIYGYLRDSGPYPMSPESFNTHCRETDMILNDIWIRVRGDRPFNTMPNVGDLAIMYEKTLQAAMKLVEENS